MNFVSTLAIRIYYEDTDCGGVVYHANYLRYFERGRTEFLRELGIDLTTYHSQGTAPTIVEANVKYKRAARYNDLLTVLTSIKELGPVSMIFRQEIVRGEELIATGELMVVCMKISSGAPTRMPPEMVRAFQTRVSTSDTSPPAQDACP